MRFKSAADKIYHEYFLPYREQEYSFLLQLALKKGYRFCRHCDYEVLNSAAPDEKLFFLRHDIDTDVGIARRMFAEEKKLGIKSTYYFRRCTLEVNFSRELHAFGSEVGYHYEEIADYAKQHGIAVREEIQNHMDEIQRNFLLNLVEMRGKTGVPIVTAASHGDFANRTLRMANTEIMTPQLRQQAGLMLEAYDDALCAHLDFRACDDEYPVYWKPSSPVPALEAGKRVILVLVHPRSWGRAPVERTKLNVQRLFDGVAYSRKIKKQSAEITEEMK